MVAMDSGADNGFFYAGQVMHFSSPFTVFLIYHKHYRMMFSLYGAILGDIIGSPYEFTGGSKAKDFPLFTENSTFTDDTVMTLAVAELRI